MTRDWPAPLRKKAAPSRILCIPPVCICKAQVWRYLATGDSSALREARRGFAAIHRVYEMNAAVRTARLPLQALRRARHAHLDGRSILVRSLWLVSISQDSLRRGSRDDRSDIRGLRCVRDDARNADFSFLQSDWYLECDWNVQLKEHDYLATMQSEQHAYNTVHMLLQALAWKAGGDTRHRDELARLREHGRLVH